MNESSATALAAAVLAGCATAAYAMAVLNEHRSQHHLAETGRIMDLGLAEYQARILKGEDPHEWAR